MKMFSLGKYICLAAIVGGWWTALGQTQLEDIDQAAASPPHSRKARQNRAQLEQLDQIPNDFRYRHQIVSVGKDVVLQTNEASREIVVISGSATVDGNVDRDVVVIGGNATVNGTVRGNVVVVFGSATLGPNAVIDESATVVFGTLEASPTAQIRGERFDLPINLHVPFFKWAKDWVTMGVLWGRPFPHQVGWVWGLAGILFLVYVLLSLVFPRPLQICVQTLETRPLGSVVAGILAYILVFPLVILLIASVVGIAVVPFLLCGLFFASLFGKVAIYQFSGQQLGRQLGVVSLEQPLIALALGVVLFWVLYMIPILGFVVWGVVAPLGLGAALLAFLSGSRKAKPLTRPPSSPSAPAPAPPPPPSGSRAPFSPLTPAPGSPDPEAAVNVAIAGAPAFAAPPAPAPTPVSSASLNATANPADCVTSAPPPPPPPPPVTPLRPTTQPLSVPPVPTISEDLASLPRAGFWIRLWATLIDLLLVVVVLWFMPFHLHEFPRFVVFLWAAYHVAMWTWRGTTIGGIVMGLRVIRVDGQPMTVSVALVRALLCFLSALPLMLGFIWAGWDKENQAWHDKIAGTVIVKVPKGMPLFLV